MQKADLERYRQLEKEIELLKAEIQGISPEFITDKVTGSLPEHPWTQTSFKLGGYDYGQYYEKVKRLEAKLTKKLAELVDERQRIEEYIENVDNATVRIILRLRHINGLKWEQIGREIGYTERQCRRKYKEFFEKKSVK